MDLVKVLKDAGLNPIDARVPSARGSFEAVGIMNHHTAAGGSADVPSLNVVRNGRPGLSGPLCQILLGRTGSIYVITDGRANHAGLGVRSALTATQRGLAPSGDARTAGDVNGNGHYYGIEVENNGIGEPYPQVQLDTLIKINVAICKAKGWNAERCIHHREWTSRKIDMSWRGDLRGLVAEGLSSKPEPPSNDHDEDDMKYMLVRVKGSNAVWATDWRTKVHVTSPTHLNVLRFFGAIVDSKGNPFEMSKAQIDAVPVLCTDRTCKH